MVIINNISQDYMESLSILRLCGQNGAVKVSVVHVEQSAHIIYTILWVSSQMTTDGCMYVCLYMNIYT